MRLLRALVPLALVLAPAVAHADEAPVGYRTPPADLAELADVPWGPSFLVAPDHASALVLRYERTISLRQLAAPEAKLAGLRFSPATKHPARDLFLHDVAWVDFQSGVSTAVTGFPAGAGVAFAGFSPNGLHAAFTVSTERRTGLWIASRKGGRATELGALRLHGATSSACAWADAASLVCKTDVSGVTALPVGSSVPQGPVVQETLEGKKAPTPTYPNLLRTAEDATLFGQLMRVQLVRVSLTGASALVGRPELIADATPSPDGRHILVETLEKQFSYQVPENLFARRYEVWGADGGAVRLLTRRPVQESLPVDFDAVPVGPRSYQWRSDAPATLVWAEALDGGDPKVDAPLRDRVFLWPAPFTGAPQVLADLPLRFHQIVYGNDDLALVSDRFFKSRRTHTFRVHPRNAGATAPPAEVVFDRSSENRYEDPGAPVLHQGPFGQPVLQVVGGDGIYLRGAGASPEGDRPFLDRFELGARRATRLFRSAAPFYENPVQVLPDGRVLTAREAATEPPNLFRVEVTSGKRERLTFVQHPLPSLAFVRKELVTYKRKDGLPLSGTLYLPPGWSPAQGPLPTLLWAYPAEFKTAAAAGQVSGSPYRFFLPGPLAATPFVLRGYAVFDNPSFPIVGEGKAEPNDTYVDQLVAAAEAAVSALERRGVSDPKRMAIGGHSYGAFTTANLLAHTNLFRAGIARSGAYNRTLTPFSFQSEERTFWEARDTYMAMSPFAHAQRIDEPLLLIHGAEDENTGTFPIQSERLFQAIKGLGGTARLVLLPKEGHGYRARESVLETLAEMDAWLERWVKPVTPARESGPVTNRAMSR